MCLGPCACSAVHGSHTLSAAATATSSPGQSAASGAARRLAALAMASGGSTVTFSRGPSPGSSAAAGCAAVPAGALGGWGLGIGAAPGSAAPASSCPGPFDALADACRTVGCGEGAGGGTGVEGAGDVPGAGLAPPPGAGDVWLAAPPAVAFAPVVPPPAAHASVPGHRLTKAAAAIGKPQAPAPHAGSVDRYRLPPPDRPVTDVHSSPPGRPFHTGTQHHAPVGVSPPLPFNAPNTWRGADRRQQQGGRGPGRGQSCQAYGEWR